ncbi:MAG: carboxypeptidase regulatory-like domain-containing protein [Terriglobales bacterium]
MAFQVPRFLVQGSVLDAAGRPVPQATIQLQEMNGNQSQTQITSMLGRFQFDVRTAGPYQATVTTPYETTQVNIDSNPMSNVVIRLEKKAPATPTSTAPTVSLNDLEAPAKAKSTLEKADKALRKADMKKAWELVNRAIQQAPNWGRPHLMRGVMDVAQQNYPAARSDYEIAIARDPQDGLALTELGKLYSDTGSYALAQRYLGQALKIEPVLWPTYLEMSRLDMRVHNFIEADQMATTAMGCTPPPPPSIHLLDGEADFQLHHYRRAVQQFSAFLTQQGPSSSPEMQQARLSAQAQMRMAQKQLSQAQ